MILYLVSVLLALMFVFAAVVAIILYFTIRGVKSAELTAREGQYVIVLQSTNEVIGTINVFADDSRAVDSKEIGYAISPAHQRNGYAFEAISAILNLLQKDLLMDMVVAGVLPENTPSIKLLEKLGFSREAIRHKALWHESLDKPVDLLYYYIDR